MDKFILVGRTIAFSTDSPLSKFFSVEGRFEAACCFVVEEAPLAKAWFSLILQLYANQKQTRQTDDYLLRLARNGGPDSPEV